MLCAALGASGCSWRANGLLLGFPGLLLGICWAAGLSLRLSGWTLSVPSSSSSACMAMAAAARMGAARMKRCTCLRCSSELSLALCRDASVCAEEVLLPCKPTNRQHLPEHISRSAHILWTETMQKRSSHNSSESQLMGKQAHPAKIERQAITGRHGPERPSCTGSIC